MDEPYIILGIGNPGREYSRTRHNLGFMVVDTLATIHEIPIRRSRFHSRVGEGSIAGKRVVLMKPQTFVNSSGLAAREALRYFRLPPERLMVVCDDVNLPTGKIRIRKSGSAGGHHGLESIIEKLDTRDFPRIRIGISVPDSLPRDASVVNHVLSGFHEDELPIVGNAIERASEAIVFWLQDGIEAAMSKFN